LKSVLSVLKESGTANILLVLKCALLVQENSGICWILRAK